jgi:hypothetical protein
MDHLPIHAGLRKSLGILQPHHFPFSQGSNNEREKSMIIEERSRLNIHTYIPNQPPTFPIKVELKNAHTPSGGKQNRQKAPLSFILTSFNIVIYGRDFMVLELLLPVILLADEFAPILLRPGAQ